MKPIRMEGETAVFTTGEVDLQGPPDVHGYTNFYVIEGPPAVYECKGVPPNFKQGYAQRDQTTTTRPHEYSRRARFKSILRNLLGVSFHEIDPGHLAVIRHYYSIANKESRETKPYETMRRILKTLSLPHYYIVIPTLITFCGQRNIMTIKKDPSIVFNQIMSEFAHLEWRFYQITGGYQKHKKTRTDIGRKYFPNLKYIAIRLLQKHNVDTSAIPALRTKRKLKELDSLFNQLYA